MSRLPADRPVRLVLVNPPFRRPVMRRYVASYFAPGFLLPPTDLLYVSAAAKRFVGAETTVVDCVARRLDVATSIAEIALSKPDLIFVQLGFATLESDLEFCARLAETLPAPIVAMGYLPSLFGKEILSRSALDAIVCGEPELALCGLIKAWQTGQSGQTVAGVLAKEDRVIVAGPPPERIADLDALPHPDHEAVDLNLYSETLLGGPIGAIFTARGCPFPCTFCVRTFGRELALRSADSVLAEVRHLVHDLGVRKLRFMDDTFNVDVERAITICEGLREMGPLVWTALARLDRVTPALAERLAAAGCKRLYVGIESGSERMLRVYKKGVDLDTMRGAIGTLRMAGVEVSGFFIVGGPGETASDFEASVAFAKQTRLDYVIVTRLQYWPGTELFDRRRDELEMSVLPFECRPKDAVGYERLLVLERKFYRRFYFRPTFIARQIRRYLTRPGELARGAARLGRYLLGGADEDFI